MMKLKIKRHGAEIPTSSLADMAFLLLTFFLLTTTIDVDKGIKLQLPAPGVTREVPEANISVIFLDDQNGIRIDDELIGLDKLGERVRQIQESQPLLIFMIKSHPKAKYGIFINVLDIMRKAEIKNISISEAVL